MLMDKHRNSPLTIGRLAKAAGVGVETLRYYERSGLMPEPCRGANGYRYYPPQAVDRLRFILQAKKLGFSLREIGELLALQDDPASGCGDVRARAEAKIADIEARIAALTRIRDALAGMAVRCNDPAPLDDCPIMEALNQHER